MKFADDEVKASEYYFKGVEDVANMSVLTNRRLIVVYGNAEESYPLSKITAVRIVFNRSLWMQIVGGDISSYRLKNTWSKRCRWFNNLGYWRWTWLPWL